MLMNHLPASSSPLLPQDLRLMKMNQPEGKGGEEENDEEVEEGNMEERALLLSKIPQKPVCLCECMKVCVCVWFG